MGVEFEEPSQGATIAVVVGPPARIVLVGEFDESNRDEVMAALAAVPTGDVIVDLVHVTFASSAFVSCLLSLRERIVDAGHRLEVSAISPVASKLMTVTGTADLFPMITGHSPTVR